MPPFADSKIEAYVGPLGLGAADDREAVIVDFLAGARSKLDIAVQELDSEAIARAILAASWRGVRVTLFLEQDYLRSSLKREKGTHVPIPPVPKAGETPEQALERVQWQEDETDLKENRRILSALLRSDVETRGDFNPKIFHQKFILRDYDQGKATTPGNPALLTGSANFTWTDTHVNLNNLFVFQSSFICRHYELEFEQLRHGLFGRGLHGEEPKTYNLAGVPVKVLFAPDHTPELEFMKQMLKGKPAPRSSVSRCRTGGRCTGSSKPGTWRRSATSRSAYAATGRRAGVRLAGGARDHELFMHDVRDRGIRAVVDEALEPPGGGQTATRS